MTPITPIQPTLSRCQQTHGFTLIELMFALAILAAGILTVMTMQLHAMRQSSNSRDLTMATEITRDQIDLIQTMPWSTLTTSSSWESPPWVAFTGYAVGELPILVDMPSGGQNLEQTYDIQWRVTPDPANGCLRTVDISTSWPGPRNQTKQVTISTARWNLDDGPSGSCP